MTRLALRRLMMNSPRALVLCSFVSTTVPAWAQTADTATAEVLFQQGRELLTAGRIVEACAKLAESQRLDPATGTLLSLADCLEQDKKFASAWSAFAGVETRARAQNRPDREQVARDRAAALRPRLSTLEIRVPAEVAAITGIEIRRDGVALGQGAWNVAVPIDGGEHSVEVTAPARQPWQRRIAVNSERDVAVITVPLLAPSAIETRPAASALESSSANAAAPAMSQPWSTLEWTGVATTGAGAVTLGVGAYFLASALGKKSDSDSGCEGNLCEPAAFADRNAAVRRGNVATALGIVGGVMVAGGATLFIVGRTRRVGNQHSAPGVAFGLDTGPDLLGARLSTSF